MTCPFNSKAPFRPIRSLHFVFGSLSKELSATRPLRFCWIVQAREAAKAAQRAATTKAAPQRSGATLVVAPPHLLSEWDEQRKQFTANKLKSIVIFKAADLLRTSAKELLNADVVIVNLMLLAEEKYFHNLRAKATYANLPQFRAAIGFKEPEPVPTLYLTT